MKVFEPTTNGSVFDGRINFVDENNVFVGFDFEQSCCEDFGYSIDDIQPATTSDLSKKECDEVNIENYHFDKEYFNEFDDNADCYCVTFRMISENNEEKFLTLYNSHNGYYSHGFSMESNKNIIFSGHL